MRKGSFFDESRNMSMKYKKGRILGKSWNIPMKSHFLCASQNIPIEKRQIVDKSRKYKLNKVRKILQKRKKHF